MCDILHLHFGKIPGICEEDDLEQAGGQKRE